MLNAPRRLPNKLEYKFLGCIYFSPLSVTHDKQRDRKEATWPPPGLLVSAEVAGHGNVY